MLEVLIARELPRVLDAREPEHAVEESPETGVEGCVAARDAEISVLALGGLEPCFDEMVGRDVLRPGGGRRGGSPEQRRRVS